MPQLPDRDSRASADGVEVFKYRTYDVDGWAYGEWRLQALGVKTVVPLEGWYPPSESGQPVIGRIRIAQCDRSNDADLRAVAPLFPTRDGSRPGLSEIVNLELEPGFFGQRLGVRLMRAALRDLAVDDLVFCEPLPTDFSNVSAEDSKAAVDSFYRGIGLSPDNRVPGVLIGRYVELLL